MGSIIRKLVVVLVLCLAPFAAAHAQITGVTQGTVFFPPENPQDCDQNSYLNWSGPGHNVRCEPLPTITATECPEGYAGAKLADNTDVKLCILITKKVCPIIDPPYCPDGTELVSLGKGPDGCDKGFICQKKETHICPVYDAPICGPDEVLVSRGVGSDGCDLGPVCQKKTYNRSLLKR